MLPLPAAPFEPAVWTQAVVGRDAQSRPGGPGTPCPTPTSAARWPCGCTAGLVQCYAEHRLVKTHPRVPKGHRRTDWDDYPPHKAAFFRRTPAWCRAQAGQLGPRRPPRSGAALADGTLHRLRQAQGLLRLAERYGAARLDAACARALAFGDPGLRTVRTILERGLDRLAGTGAPPGAPVAAGAFLRGPAELLAARGRAAGRRRGRRGHGGGAAVDRPAVPAARRPRARPRCTSSGAGSRRSSWGACWTPWSSAWPRPSRGGSGYLDFLELLLEDEVQRRAQHGLARRLAAARFEALKTFEEFDFAADSGLPAQQIRDLATCHFLEARACVLICGPVGAGKTHVATGLGVEACRRGHAVLFAKTARLLRDLAGGRADGSWEVRLRRYLKPDLLILDDFAMKELTASQAEDVYELIDARVGRRSLVVTSNRAPADWYPLFPNAGAGGERAGPAGERGPPPHPDRQELPPPAAARPPRPAAPAPAPGAGRGPRAGG